MLAASPADAAVGVAAALPVRIDGTPEAADASDDGRVWDDERVAASLGCSPANVMRTRRRSVDEGLDQALRVRKTGPGRPPKIDAAEACLVAPARSEPPEARAARAARTVRTVRTVRPVADLDVSLGVAESWLGDLVSG